MPRQRQYLNVPYEERQEAKNLGAIWDTKKLLKFLLKSLKNKI
ncbi:DUF5710 domain-containing protein [Campylobacter cuniculorum]|nr:DUF5710 domain-containing protein [Campylobacter cuniculorum]